MLSNRLIILIAVVALAIDVECGSSWFGKKKGKTTTTTKGKKKPPPRGDAKDKPIYEPPIIDTPTPRPFDRPTPRPEPISDDSDSDDYNSVISDDYSDDDSYHDSPTPPTPIYDRPTSKPTPIYDRPTSKPTPIYDRPTSRPTPIHNNDDDYNNPSDNKVDAWKKLYKELFTSTWSQVTPAVANQMVQKLSDGLKDPAVGGSVPPLWKQEIEFWAEAGRIDVKKCDSAHDDRLSQRYLDAFLRYPLRQEPNRLGPIKIYLDDIRERQVRECKDLPSKLQRLVDNIPAAARKVVEKLENGVSDDVANNAAYILAGHYKGGSGNRYTGRHPRGPETDRKTFDKLYDQHILKPCEKVMEPLGTMSGFAAYAQRYQIRSGMNLNTRDWLFNHAQLCAPFVSGNKEQIKDEVFRALPSVIHNYRAMSSSHQAMYRS